MTVTSAHGVLLDADAADYTLRALRLLVGTLPKVFRHPPLGHVDAYVMHRFLDDVEV